MGTAPSANGHNGRQTGGRFAKGNRGGPGNPHAKRTAELRAMLLDAVTDEDFRAAVRRLIESAKAGELAAIRELLDRLVGRTGPAGEPAPQAAPIVVQLSPADVQHASECLAALGESADPIGPGRRAG